MWIIKNERLPMVLLTSRVLVETAVQRQRKRKAGEKERFVNESLQTQLKGVAVCRRNM